MKTAVIYWSGTGNTKTMAEAVAEGAGAELFNVSDFSGSIDDYEAVAFGCPAMGAVLVNGEGLIVNEVPDADALEQCRALGRKLAE
ncbi:MAG: flavodoxin domain-containing protein [Ruminiclostridium sp.]